MTKNIVLCGFMGSGKSVTGKLIAEKLGLTFVDMDDFIEKENQMTVSEIFDKYGEPAFRKMETDAAKLLGEKTGLVIACGGGTVLSPQNVAYLKSGGDIFYLEVSADTVKKRLKNDTTRPLLAKDKENAIESLLNKREAVYKNAADFVIDSNGTKFSAADEIIKIYNSKL